MIMNISANVRIYYLLVKRMTKPEIFALRKYNIKKKPDKPAFISDII